MNEKPAQEPVQPPVPDMADDAGDARSPFRVARWKVWSRYLRIRVARAVLLPELSTGMAKEIRKSVYEDSGLTSGYVLMCALSAGIATLGLLQSSTAVVIGAMLISPLMGPIAALGFGFASLDGHRIRDAARVLLVGAAIGILTGVLLTWLSPIRNATPEILARTQPTLLDLAVALFSGLAGGYATVIRKGGTAIGVAIATALMPPLATLGYGLGVLQPGFAFGALLLFLTNLAAITFAFALIARLSGAARPLIKVELTPRYITILVLAFLALATPLSMTLIRVKHEATMRSAASSAILAATGESSARIAQLEVSWPLLGEPMVEALVITPNYSTNAAREAEIRLEQELGEKVTINLQQVLAADVQSQTRALVDAAMERTIAGISADVPPIDKIRQAIGLPTLSLWTNRAARMVYIEPAAAPDWTLADYREIERRANAVDEVWTVRVIPPVVPRLRILLGPPPESEVQPESPSTAAEETAEPLPEEGTVPADVAIWAVQRWGLSKVTLTAPESEARKALAKALTDTGIGIVPRVPAEDAASNIAVIGIHAPRPTAPPLPSPSPTAAATAQPAP